MLQQAKRKGWKSQKREGRGGGFMWALASMPQETQIAIRVAEERTILSQPGNLPVVLSFGVNWSLLENIVLFYYAFTCIYAAIKKYTRKELRVYFS